MHAADQPVTLTDVVRRARFCSNRDHFRLVQIRLGNPFDRSRHRRREQSRLTCRRRFFQNSLHVVDEAHAQHFIRLIQHQCFELRQIKRPFVQMINHTTWRANHHMHTTAQSGQLRAITLTTINRQHMEIWHVLRIRLKSLSHLNRQLTCWRQHQSLRCDLRHVNVR